MRGLCIEISLLIIFTESLELLSSFNGFSRLGIPLSSPSKQVRELSPSSVDDMPPIPTVPIPELEATEWLPKESLSSLSKIFCVFPLTLLLRGAKGEVVVGEVLSFPLIN